MKLENVNDAKKIVRFSLLGFIISFIFVIVAFYMLDASMDLKVEDIPFFLIAIVLAIQGCTPFILMWNHNLKLKDLKAQKKPVE